MVIIPALLCLATLLKLISISNAIRWLGRDAARYRKDVLRNKPQTVLALEVLLQISRADFFPFGLKDYRLAQERPGCKRIKTILVAAVPHLAGNPPAAGGRESGGNNSHGRSS
jgi:hypothetical protein